FAPWHRNLHSENCESRFRLLSPHETQSFPELALQSMKTTKTRLKPIDPPYLKFVEPRFLPSLLASGAAILASQHQLSAAQKSVFYLGLYRISLRPPRMRDRGCPAERA